MYQTLWAVTGEIDWKSSCFGHKAQSCWNPTVVNIIKTLLELTVLKEGGKFRNLSCWGNTGDGQKYWLSRSPVPRNKLYQFKQGRLTNCFQYSLYLIQCVSLVSAVVIKHPVRRLFRRGTVYLSYNSRSQFIVAGESRQGPKQLVTAHPPSRVERNKFLHVHLHSC